MRITHITGALGCSILACLHSQATFGVPGIDIIHGHVLQQFNALGQTSSLSISGHQTDGCALIS